MVRSVSDAQPGIRLTWNASGDLSWLGHAASAQGTVATEAALGWTGYLRVDAELECMRVRARAAAPRRDREQPAPRAFGD